MLRATLAGLFVLASLSALATPAQAVYICQATTFLSDLDVDDDDPYVADAHCSTENLVSYTCKARVTLWDGGSVTRTAGCEPLICPEHCPPPPATSSAQQGPCAVGADPTLTAPLVQVTCSTQPAIGYDCHTRAWADPFGVHRDHVECDPLLYCVTEPCPGGGPIRI